jgi:hypothetical protein
MKEWVIRLDAKLDAFIASNEQKQAGQDDKINAIMSDLRSHEASSGHPMIEKLDARVDAVSYAQERRAGREDVIKWLFGASLFSLVASVFSILVALSAIFGGG